MGKVNEPHKHMRDDNLKEVLRSRGAREVVPGSGFMVIDDIDYDTWGPAEALAHFVKSARDTGEQRIRDEEARRKEAAREIADTLHDIVREEIDKEQEE
jgi:hypothetical protein